MILLQIRFTTESVSEKKLENRLIFSEVMGKSLVSCFWTLGVEAEFSLADTTICCDSPAGQSIVKVNKSSSTTSCRGAKGRG